MNDTSKVTAAIIQIGDELLYTDIGTENRVFVAEELKSLNIQIESVHTVRDEIDALSSLVKYVSGRVTYVITTGGLGPTLDDITLEAIAHAFDLKAIEKDAMDASAYAQMSGSETKEPILRHVPEGAEIIESGHGPVVRTKNVFSLPGLPRLVKARFPALKAQLQSGAKMEERSISVDVPQSEIAEILEKAQQRFPSVAVGCYPSKEEGGETGITCSGPDIGGIDKCLTFIKTEITTS